MKKQYLFPLFLSALFNSLLYIFIYFIDNSIVQLNVGKLVNISFQIVGGAILLYVFSKKPVACLIAYFFGILLFLIQLILYPDIRQITFNFILPFFLGALPYVLLFKIEDIDILKSKLMDLSYIFFLIGFIGIMIVNKIAPGEYSLSVSNMLLISAVLFFLKYFDNRKKKDFIFGFISTCLFILFGSRSSVLGLIWFFALFSIRKFKQFPNWLKLTSLALIFIILLNYFANYGIAEKIYDILTSYGIESRTLSLLLTNINYTSGRDVIANNVINLIKEEPIIGNGIGAAQYYMGDYSHNIILDILVGSGVIVGSISILLLSYIIIKALIIDNSGLVIVFISIGLVFLFVSGFVIEWPPFWALVGLTLREKHQKITIMRG